MGPLRLGVPEMTTEERSLPTWNAEQRARWQETIDFALVDRLTRQIDAERAARWQRWIYRVRLTGLFIVQAVPLAVLAKLMWVWATAPGR